ncbi:tetratricopeptide repeat protein [Ligilactobacillus ceti]|uniref:Tetratricopeptide repeat family protein n=1 Tax=Ligilactobacillus ceti DSM 22408 TaxID=1122146 RepID=A0A0R2KHN4_9LACO|nr:tetratricopeptide repeat protein [Ligilactobacillus ceti]KRN88882.1 tetratricopeptide repeat family protein [Ligilactobacillus ceti DSM 22408]
MTYSEQLIDMLEMGQIDEAYAIFPKALENDDDEMLYSLAEELYSLGFSDLAKKAYQLLLERYPDEDQIRTALADIAISEGHDDEVIQYLADIKPDSDAYLQSLLVAADYYQTQAMFEVSESKLLRALSLAPDEPIIQFALAEFYFNIKEYHKAQKLYLELIKNGVLELSRVDLVQRLGVSYAGQGKFEKALAYLDQIHEEKLDIDTRFQLAFTQLQLGMLDEAQNSFEKLIELDPGYATAYPYLADIQQEKGQLGEALKTYQEGLAVDEYNIELYRKASELALQLGEVELAQRYLKTALSQDEHNLTLVLALSNLYLQHDMHQENIAFLNEYLAEGEIDPQIHWNLGRSYAAIDDYPEAVKNYQAVQEALHNNLDFLKDAAFVYRNAGERNLALECLNLYLQERPNDSEVLELQEALEDY